MRRLKDKRTRLDLASNTLERYPEASMITPLCPKPVYFIGVDISKSSFDVFIKGEKSVTKYDNSADGIEGFITKHASTLEQGFTVMEATGGYEAALLIAMVKRGYRVHRLHPNTSHHFLSSLKRLAKNDAIDAKGLARFASERHDELRLATLKDANQEKLRLLVRLRDEYVADRAGEKTRLQSPLYATMTSFIEKHIEDLDTLIAAIEKDIDACLNDNDLIRGKAKVCKEMSGIGDKIAMNILAFLPELGTLTRREVAALTGTAPRVRDSGTKIGHRSLQGGRCLLKKSLYQAALSASRSKKGYKEFYDRLIDAGKQKKVALMAVARKIGVVLNARMKEFLENAEKAQKI
jgi:transposase